MYRKYQNCLCTLRESSSSQSDVKSYRAFALAPAVAVLGLLGDCWSVEGNQLLEYDHNKTTFYNKLKNHWCNGGINSSICVDWTRIPAIIKKRSVKSLPLLDLPMKTHIGKLVFKTIPQYLNHPCNENYLVCNIITSPWRVFQCNTWTALNKGPGENAFPAAETTRAPVRVNVPSD